MSSPCSNRIVCPGSDSPFANTSSEAPDPFLYLGKSYCDHRLNGGFPKIYYSEVSQEDADLGAAALCPIETVGFFSPVAVGPPPAYPPPDEPSCFFDCPDTTTPDADAIRFTNTAQSCTACCQAGPCESFTMAADKIQGRSQSEADFWAKKFACYAATRMVLAHCPGATCLVIDGVTICQPHFPTYNPPPAIAIFWNGPQSCEAQCPDGTVNVYRVLPGRFSGRNQLQADSAAASYACRQANRNRFCVTDLAGHCCLGSSPSFTITAFGGSGSVGWAFSSGALPNGMAATASGRTVTISGTPSSAGVFTFGFTATDALGHAVTKSFTISVIGITGSATLPAFVKNVAYSHQITVTGGTAPYQFAIVSGDFPPGLTMSTDGLISGTPTVDPALYPVFVAFRDSTAATCTETVSFDEAPAACVPTVTPALESTFGISATLAVFCVKTGTVFALNSGDYQTLLEINPTTGAILHSFSIGADQVGCLSYENTHQRLYVGYQTGLLMRVASVDPVTRTVVNSTTLNTGTITSLSLPQLIAYDPVRDKMWVCDTQNIIFVLNCATFSYSVIDFYNAAAPFVPTESMAYCSANDVMAVAGDFLPDSGPPRQGMAIVSPGSLTYAIYDFGGGVTNDGADMAYCPDNNRLYLALDTKLYIINPAAPAIGSSITLSSRVYGVVYNACTKRIQAISADNAYNAIAHYINPVSNTVISSFGIAPKMYQTYPTAMWYDSTNARVWLGTQTALLKFT